jgi:hypothetical protein
MPQVQSMCGKASGRLHGILRLAVTDELLAIRLSPSQLSAGYDLAPRAPE